MNYNFSCSLWHLCMPNPNDHTWTQEQRCLSFPVAPIVLIRIWPNRIKNKNLDWFLEMTSTAHLRRLSISSSFQHTQRLLAKQKKKTHFLEEIIYLRWERSEGVALDLPMSPIKAWELSYWMDPNTPIRKSHRKF